MTSSKWAEIILKERRLKLSRFYEANDPFELKLIDIRSRETRDMATMIGETLNASVGMICFGAAWSSPVMWAHYADKHAGVCLGFEIHDSLLTKIKYTDKKIAASFGSHLPDHGISEALLTAIRTTKATDWSYEREYRAESWLKEPDPKSNLYFMDFGPQMKLRELVIGHRCEWTTGNASDRIGAVDAPVRICKARPAFGKFEMVQQNQVKPLVIRPELAGK